MIIIVKCVFSWEELLKIEMIEWFGEGISQNQMSLMSGCPLFHIEQ